MNFKNIIKNRKFQISIVIIVILSVAFFWGGNDNVKPLDPEEMARDAGITEEVASEVKEQEDKDEEDNKKELDQEEQETQDEIKEEENKQEKIEQQKAEKSQIIAQDNKNKGQKDKYQTDPTPTGKPKPKEWQETKVDKQEQLTATLSITTKSILNNMDMFNMDKIEVLPKDGVIYNTKQVNFYQGENVFDVLLRETRNNKIHMEFTMTPLYNSNYIEGINNIYEFDCGELSGWMYRVNGWFPNYGASRYQLEDGDKIEWIYTCDLGRDIGGDMTNQGGR